MLQIINDSAAANNKDSAVAAIESHAMTPKGVEIFGSCARARLPSATTALIVIGVIEIQSAFVPSVFPRRSRQLKIVFGVTTSFIVAGRFLLQQ
jgi:hypothetical protein